MAIGTATNFGKHSGGFHDVSEIMYFDRPLSLEQRMLVEDYLCYKVRLCARTGSVPYNYECWL